MSTSRAKQKQQGRITKTKKSGNGAKKGEFKRKKMRRGSKLMTASMSKKKRR